MGSIYQIKRKSGITYYIAYYHEGKQYREKVGSTKDGLTEKHAKKALQARMGSIAQGKFDIIETKRYPYFDKLIDEYLEWSETNKHSYKRDILSSKHLKAYFGNKRINKITRFMIEGYKKKRRDEIKTSKRNIGKNVKDISFASINRELAMLKHFFSMAIGWGKVDHNPVKGIKMFPERGRERFLNKEEIVALVEACGKSRNNALQTIVITAISTGARLSEILNLKAKDLDFRSSVINLEHTKNGERGKVPMNDHLREVLSVYLKNHNNEYLFCMNNGKPYKDIRSALRKALKDAHIKNFRFHDLRHTFASHLVMSGVEGVTLQELGRWKTPKMIMRYAHLSAEHKKKAVDNLGSLFNNNYETSTKVILGDFSKT